MRLFRLAIYFIVIILVQSCATKHAKNFILPEPVNTKDHPILIQMKKNFGTHGGVYADNKFDGARLNDFIQLSKDTFAAIIEPENKPINSSPWYSFRIWTDEERDIVLKLDYTGYGHRYVPKLSVDGKNWTIYPEDEVVRDGEDAYIKLSIKNTPLWVSAQELIVTKDIIVWSEEMAKHPSVTMSIVGSSKLGKPLPHLLITNGDHKRKDAVVVIGRQHPPEVTGFLAMQAFIEKILDKSALSNKFLDDHVVYVYPLMNPDGVDLGHWRHNAGGIDMNRDWAYYHQEETKAVTDHIVFNTSRQKNKVLVGLDFHSTWEDVYYTLDKKTQTPDLATFSDDWLKAIGEGIPDYEINEAPYPLNQPISKAWFYLQFNAASVTYEIGDKTPRDFIKVKGDVSAKTMMEVLLSYKEKS